MQIKDQMIISPDSLNDLRCPVCNDILYLGRCDSPNENQYIVAHCDVVININVDRYLCHVWKTPKTEAEIKVERDAAYKKQIDALSY